MSAKTDFDLWGAQIHDPLFFHLKSVTDQFFYGDDVCSFPEK